LPTLKGYQQTLTPPELFEWLPDLEGIKKQKKPPYQWLFFV
jgi:hypothetical protein